MLIKSTYEVLDQEQFENAARGAAQPPEGLKAVAVIPSLDHAHITVLWEADSIESVKSYVDGIVGSTVGSVYHPVDERWIRGLG